MATEKILAWITPTKVRTITAKDMLSRSLIVAVETDVQAVEAILLGCALAVGITQREVVHTHIITTLHVDAVVLAQ